jgi:ABC-2 type transport system ATP-binding protein
MIEAKGLTKRFGPHTALDALHLTIQRGEIFCLLGTNGAGKTTTLKLLLGFLKPTSGMACICGVDVARNSKEARQQLLYLPEQIALYGEMTGLENLEYFAALARVADRSPEHLRACLIQAGLASEASDQPAATYSKGMRQKVGVALAIAKQAKAMLLDEPTSGLDPQASAEFHELLCRQRDRGAAILMATHDLFRAREAGTRIGLLRRGQLVQTLAAREVSASDLEALYLEVMRS